MWVTHLIIHFLCTVSVLAVEVVAAVPHGANELKKKAIEMNDEWVFFPNPWMHELHTL